MHDRPTNCSRAQTEPWAHGAHVLPTREYLPVFPCALAFWSVGPHVFGGSLE